MYCYLEINLPLSLFVSVYQQTLKTHININIKIVGLFMYLEYVQTREQGPHLNNEILRKNKIGNIMFALSHSEYHPYCICLY
jgi:hypothetical protein